MLRVGIIGFGKMGRIRADAVNSDGRGRVVAIVEPNAKDVASNVRLCQNVEELLADSGIDAIFVCTPNVYNMPLTIAGLKAGKHVFCEKPPAFTSKDVVSVIECERVSGRKLMYGLNHRHHESVRKVKEMVDSGVYDRILWMRGRYGKSVSPDFFNEWRAKKDLAGGGIMLDQGIHMLDLFLMMAGDFDEVSAYVSNLYWKTDVEDNVFAIFRNKEGVVASLHSTMTQWRHLFSFEIFLEKGYFVINGLLTASGTYGDEVLTIAKNRTTAPAATWSDEEHFRFHIDGSWQNEVRSFFDSILNGTPIEHGNSEQAFKLMRLMDRIYENGSVHR